MVWRRLGRAASERGAAAVEFALVASLLFLVVFGIVDFGWMANRDVLINNASREGAREGAVNPDQASIVSVVNASLSSLPAADVSVLVTCRKPDGNPCASFAADAASGGVVIVRVNYTHRWITPAGLGFGSTIDLSRTTEMRIE